ncbi:hypothetical protein DSO57_1006812 [Entomophthora muscae]|uniref:Uncharacterized protein n=1 Tax=Entomophthora muscae TaxID=34485 RepID=A0ACC2RYS5_9FUNG|nr:hypothetical protein DSO57_1006812 [Entomophthora muscae]
MSKVSFYFDAAQQQCIAQNSSTLSPCTPFLSKHECMKTCLEPKLIPKGTSITNVNAFESSRQYLQCPSSKGNECVILLGTKYVCSCQTKPLALTNATISDPHVTEM